MIIIQKHTFEKPKQLHSSNSGQVKKEGGRNGANHGGILPLPLFLHLDSGNLAGGLVTPLPLLSGGKGGGRGKGGRFLQGLCFLHVLIHQAAPSLYVMLHDCSATWQNPTIKSNLFP